MAIFIAKGKIYVVPSCDIRNCRHTVFVRLNEQRNVGPSRRLCLELIELFWVLPGSNIKAQACGL
jgi:hypothetical protein